jgi:hypothetical protein
LSTDAASTHSPSPPLEGAASQRSRRFGTGRRLMIALVIVALALVGLRLYLPYFLRDYINQQLHRMENYDGHVASVHVALWRGAYALRELTIVKRKADKNSPFCAIDELQLAIQWKALLHGSVVGKAEFIAPTLNLVQGESSADTQLGTDQNWAKSLEKLFPFKFNEVNIHRGTVRFKAPGIPNRDAMVLHGIEAGITNLTNVLDRNNEAFARFELHGRMLGNAPLRIDGRMNPYADSPTFEIDLQLERVQLKELNPWLAVYAKVNADDGSISLYSSSAAADRKFKGYVKPILKDVKIVSVEAEHANPLEKLWAALVQFAATIFKNQPHDQLATKIPFSGTIDDPKAGVFATVVNVLRNAFVAAFSSSIDQKIKVQDVGDPSEDKAGASKEGAASKGG